MTEERLLLLLSAAEQQQKSIEKAISVFYSEQKNAEAQEAQRIQILERHAFLLDGLLESVRRLLSLLPHWALWLCVSFMAGTFFGIVLV